ncbi:hypothetical protein F4561_005930 [Lipingzhangella halophila]|uniref:DUF1023 domain-containing protein n=1 Tax=Lipingzhangella halophila TaxID=1783352 RepID=A0A7W7RP57_9ACTN|nr:alpha/beta hydrolase [Lipingzhangella halophila]MBB4935036.1 hypothetical protein [Lipingzhangella halophila]
MPRRNQAVERGASLIEYGGVLLLVAAIGVVVFGSGIPNQVFGLISDALACVGQEGDCSAEDSDQAAPDEEPDTEGDPDSDTGGDPADPGSPVEVSPAPEASGDWGDGVVTQATDLGAGIEDGAGDVACLAHLCENEEFQDTWGDVGDTAVNADPAIWDGENGGPETHNVVFGFGDDDPELAPDPDASPEEVNDWWEELDPGERAEVMQEEPEHIRDLNGIPADVRNNLNRDFLDDEVDRLLEEEDLTREEVLNRENDDLGSTEVQELVDLQDTLENGKVEDGEVVSEGHEYYLLELDPDEERSIVSRGNPDTADNVSTLVPGTGIEWTAVNGQLGRADNMYDAAVTADRDADHASIAWIGYDTPAAWQADGELWARQGQEELRGFQDGLRLTHEDDSPSRNTVVGHSYGSTVAGTAASDDAGLDADNLIFVGSPGTSVDSVDELSGFDDSNVFATRGNDDWISWVPGFVHGRDPYDQQYGASRFASDDGTEHPQYFNNPESEQMEYMGEIIAG